MLAADSTSGVGLGPRWRDPPGGELNGDPPGAWRRVGRGRAAFDSRWRCRFATFFSDGPFQTLPGFREFYPEDFARRNHIFRLWRQTANNFGFAEYDARAEPLDLYKAKSGDEIEGQLFSFR